VQEFGEEVRLRFDGKTDFYFDHEGNPTGSGHVMPRWQADAEEPASLVPE
jgi:hypothetical protein